jgi:hypothetical protein
MARRDRSGRDRTAEYAARAARRGPALPDLAPLFPHLRRGAVLAFRDEELRMDLEQERALAELEGRDPDAAAAAYARRERAWSALTTELDPEGLP